MPFKKGEGGRPKGARNKYSVFKEALVDGIELAAKQAELKGGMPELVAETWSKDPVGVLNIVARQIPKDLNIHKDEVLRIILERAETDEDEKADPGVEPLDIVQRGTSERATEG